MRTCHWCNGHGCGECRMEGHMGWVDWYIDTSPGSPVDAVEKVIGCMENKPSKEPDDGRFENE